MVTLVTQQSLRSCQSLSFCYLCGEEFVPTDVKNRDHVPAQGIFDLKDRQPLILPTHLRCNSVHTLVDEKIAQFIALRRHIVPRREVRRLKFALSPDLSMSAVVNLPIDMAVWRWIKGFHAALYRAPVGDIRGALVTPFRRGQNLNGQIAIEPIKPQHRAFVETIKMNRARNNLDRIECNRGKLIYECVWCLSDDQRVWMCIFALDIYDWKDLGRTKYFPSCGCAGFYLAPNNARPENATVGTKSKIAVPNIDQFDPFSP